MTLQYKSERKMTMERSLTLYLLSSLAKVFPDGIYGEPLAGRQSLLANEEYSFQLALLPEGGGHFKFDLDLLVESPLADCITVRRVVNVPSELPAYEDADGDYLRKAPGLFPDALVPMTWPAVEAIPGRFTALWVTVRPDGRFAAGRYPVGITLANEELGIRECAEFELELIGAALPEQELLYTQWFHADCIASVHRTEVFGERHWELIGRYMETAAANGVNLLLTPIFTPPLDTQPGGERPTVQLVDVFSTPEGYRFGFERLERWLTLAEQAGIHQFEFSHLFTQWGAEHAPKIVALVNGEERRIFGWETAADSPEYAAFLRAFLPELRAFLQNRGIWESCWFHVSDEPGIAAIENYRRAAALLEECLPGAKRMDALSDLDFYREGLVPTPIAATTGIEPFLNAGVSPLWAYYCCSQGVDVSNRFFAMPSARSRVIAAQLYKYDIRGFLHWGYNFYYTQYSREGIDPWLTTDAGCAFPSGDAFSVYPGEDGPVESIRLKVFHEALQDLRAFRLLESLAGREAVMAILEDGGKPITFSRYPRSERYVLGLRERVNEMIRALCAGTSESLKIHA